MFLSDFKFNTFLVLQIWLAFVKCVSHWNIRLQMWQTRSCNEGVALPTKGFVAELGGCSCVSRNENHGEDWRLRAAYTMGSRVKLSYRGLPTANWHRSSPQGAGFFFAKICVLRKLALITQIDQWPRWGHLLLWTFTSCKLYSRGYALVWFFLQSLFCRPVGTGH